MDKIQIWADVHWAHKTSTKNNDANNLLGRTPRMARNGIAVLLRDR